MIIDLVKAAIERYNMFDGVKTVTVAISGGADSVVLLHVLNELKDEYGFSLKAAHLNHMLRGNESDRDEQFAADYCRTLGVPFVSERIDVAAAAKNSKESTELAARRLRYDFLLRETGNGVLATAHTASDNIETVLHNLTRGTGIAGLCGIPPIRDNIVRPLILVTRGEIEEYAAKNSLLFVTDSTNLEDVYTRNRLRHKVVPELVGINEAAVQNVSRMCADIREDASFIDGEAEKAYDGCRVGRGLSVEMLKGLHPAIRSRVILRLCRDVTGTAPESRHIALIEEMLTKDTVRVNIKGNRFAVKRKGLLTFEGGAGGENGFFVPLGSQFPASVNGMSVELVSIDEYKKTQRINSLLLKFAVDYDKICGRLVIRNRIPGDKIRPVGRNVTKSFKKLFNENNIPEDLREALPILADDNGVLWLYGFGADARAAVDASTKRVLLMGKVPNLEV